MKRFTLLVMLLLVSTGANSQGINPISPPANWMIQVIDPAFAVPSNFYTTPALISSSGRFSNLTITGGTLANAAQAFNLTATQPTTPVAIQNAVVWTITSAGSASQVNRGIQIGYAAGYTGSSTTTAAFFINTAAGTGNTLVPSAGNTVVGNIGAQGNANAAGSLQIGMLGNGVNGTNNVGVFGIANSVGTLSIGVVGSAGTGTTQIGGWFSLTQATNPTSSAALVADNGAQAVPIAIWANNTATVATVTQTGGLTATLTSASGTSTVCNTAGTSTALTLVASGTACAASAMRFKDAYPEQALNLTGLDQLRTDVPWSYRRDSGTYENGLIHVGLIADDVESMDPRCVVRDGEGKLLNYYDRCVLAYLVADRKALKARIIALEERVH